MREVEFELPNPTGQADSRWLPKVPRVIYITGSEEAPPWKWSDKATQACKWAKRPDEKSVQAIMSDGTEIVITRSHNAWPIRT
jgi:hypothetical protein